MSVSEAKQGRNAARKLVAESDVAPETLKLVAKAPPEVSQGEGLGALVSPEEGRERLATFASPR